MKEQPTTNKPPVQRLAYTVAEAAKAIGTSPPTVYALIRANCGFPAIKLGQKNIIPVAPLEAWLASRACTEIDLTL